MSMARLGAYAAWLTLIGVVTFAVIAPIVVAGQRVTGVADPGLINAYYRHPQLLVVALGSFLILPIFVALIVSLRRVVPEAGGDRSMAHIGFAIALAAVPLLAAQSALQMALVRLTEAGADPLAVFLSWDYLYNSGLYAFEASYIAAFSLAMRGAAGFPRWLPAFGLFVAALQLVNMSSLVIGLPDAATLPGNLAFMAWIAGVAVGLSRLRRGERSELSGVPA